MAYRPKDTQERILHRLKIARGHLEKVMKMVEKDEYCIDIINQSSAIQSALKEADNLILENHLKSCVDKFFKSNKQEKAVSELMQVFHKK